MAKWTEAQHPRDWRGRFITVGAHVRLQGGLIGTVREIMTGSGRFTPQAKVETRDGRIAWVPNDRLTVAEPPRGYAFMGDGNIAGIGDKVRHTDEPGEDIIKSVNKNGSVTVGKQGDPTSDREVDPSTLTRPGMTTDPEIQRQTERGTELPGGTPDLPTESNGPRRQTVEQERASATDELLKAQNYDDLIPDNVDEAVRLARSDVEQYLRDHPNEMVPVRVGSKDYILDISPELARDSLRRGRQGRVTPTQTPILEPDVSEQDQIARMAPRAFMSSRQIRAQATPQETRMLDRADAKYTQAENRARSAAAARRQRGQRIQSNAETRAYANLQRAEDERAAAYRQVQDRIQREPAPEETAPTTPLPSANAPAAPRHEADSPPPTPKPSTPDVPAGAPDTAPTGAMSSEGRPLAVGNHIQAGNRTGVIEQVRIGAGRNGADFVVYRGDDTGRTHTATTGRVRHTESAPASPGEDVAPSTDAPSTDAPPAPTPDVTPTDAPAAPPSDVRAPGATAPGIRKETYERGDVVQIGTTGTQLWTVTRQNPDGTLLLVSDPSRSRQAGTPSRTRTIHKDRVVLATDTRENPNSRSYIPPEEHNAPSPESTAPAESASDAAPDVTSAPSSNMRFTAQSTPSQRDLDNYGSRYGGKYVALPATNEYREGDIIEGANGQRWHIDSAPSNTQAYYMLSRTDGAGNRGRARSLSNARPAARREGITESTPNLNALLGQTRNAPRDAMLDRMTPEELASVRREVDAEVTRLNLSGRMGDRGRLQRAERLQAEMRRRAVAANAPGDSAASAPFTDGNVLEAIGGESLGTDEVAALFGVPQPQALAALRRLERDGYVTRNSGEGSGDTVSGGRRRIESLNWESAAGRDDPDGHQQLVDRYRREHPEDTNTTPDATPGNAAPTRPDTAPDVAQAPSGTPTPDAGRPLAVGDRVTVNGRSGVITSIRQNSGIAMYRADGEERLRSSRIDRFTRSDATPDAAAPDAPAAPTEPNVPSSAAAANFQRGANAARVSMDDGSDSAVQDALRQAGSEDPAADFRHIMEVRGSRNQNARLEEVLDRLNPNTGDGAVTKSPYSLPVDSRTGGIVRAPAPITDAAELSAWGDRRDEILNSGGPNLIDILNKTNGPTRNLDSDERTAIENMYGDLGKDKNYRVKWAQALVQDSSRPGGTAYKLFLMGTVNEKTTGEKVGTIHRSISFKNGKAYDAHNDLLHLQPTVQGQGIARDIYRRQENWYIRNRVDKVTIHANIDVGGYAWARQGFDYDSWTAANYHLRTLKTRLAQNSRLAPYRGTPEYESATKQITDWLTQMNGDTSGKTINYPTPYEVSMLGHTPGAQTWLGKDLMLGTDWLAVKRLTPGTLRGQSDA